MSRYESIGFFVFGGGGAILFFETSISSSGSLLRLVPLLRDGNRVIIWYQ